MENLIVFLHCKDIKISNSYKIRIGIVNVD